MTTTGIHFCLLVYLFTLVASDDACFHVIGQLKCSSNPSRHENIKIELFDRDLVIDEIMGLTFSQTNGSFTLFGCGRDIRVDLLFENYPDPFLRVTHYCKITMGDNRYDYDLPQIFMPVTLNLGIIEIDDGMPRAVESEKMEETFDEIVEYEKSEDFESINFGFIGRMSGYAGAKEIHQLIEESPSSSIPTLICAVKKYCLADWYHIETPSFNHYTGYDRYVRLVYIRAEIKFSSLDKGDELSEKTLKYFRPYALPGDIVTQFIPKSLGGKDRCDNAFNNIHSSPDISKWKDALKECYDYLKADETNVIRFIYILDYRIETFRPSALFYHFIFYSNNGQQIVKTVDGKFRNYKQKEDL